MNLVDLLHDEIRLAVLTGDCDLGTAEPYGGIRPGRWNNWKGRAPVLYATAAQHRTGIFRKVLQRLRPETVYLNSMFSPTGAILPILQSMIRRKTRIVLAPRGMLKPSALQHRRWKKTPWLQFLRLSRLSGRLVFHATSEIEADEIREQFGPGARVTVIPNVPTIMQHPSPRIRKEPGSLRISFVGRIHPVKNLLFAIRLLKDIDFQCSFTVVGPIEDDAYYQQCRREVAALPANVSVHFNGAVTHEESLQLAADSHIMLLPTLGENFGHAIYESLACGVPVVISDQTYWRFLEASQSGWDIPLSSPEFFSQALQLAASFDQSQLDTLRAGARRRADDYLRENDFRGAYLRLFGIDDVSRTAGIAPEPQIRD